ncbi:MAG: redoxin domain-containing protein [Nitrosomonadales bacterium]|nr:MAG: redoxin domain-containing protein [Nitrosomonadales bacterium]
MRYLLFVLLLTLSAAAGSVESVHSFVPGSMKKIISAREGKPFILVFWSLDCQYCPTELKMLGKLKRQYTDKLDIILFATDTLNDEPQLISRAESYGIREVEQWVFAGDIPERLRFEIDQRWYGEVPRTHFYDRNHKRIVKTGLVDQKFIKSWLAHNNKSELKLH